MDRYWKTSIHISFGVRSIAVSICEQAYGKISVSFAEQRKHTTNRECDGPWMEAERMNRSRGADQGHMFENGAELHFLTRGFDAPGQSFRDSPVGLQAAKAVQICRRC